MKVITIISGESWVHTWGLGGANASVEVQAAILQNAIVLDPHVCASVKLVQKAQALWVPDSQGWEAPVVQSNVFPDMLLQMWHKGISWVAILRQWSLTPRANDVSTKTDFREASVLSDSIAKEIWILEQQARQSEFIHWP